MMKKNISFSINKKNKAAIEKLKFEAQIRNKSISFIFSEIILKHYNEYNAKN